jgi:hypothetical protein
MAMLEQTDVALPNQEVWSCGCMEIDGVVAQACSASIDAGDPAQPPVGGVVPSPVCFRLAQAGARKQGASMKTEDDEKPEKENDKKEKPPEEPEETKPKGHHAHIPRR